MGPVLIIMIMVEAVMTDAGSDGGDGENAKEEEEKSFYLLSD